MSNMIDVLVVDAHKAALMMDGDVVARCDTKGIAYEIASKVNSHGKLTEQNKLLREALTMLHSNFSQWGSHLSPMDESALKSSLKVLSDGE